MEPNYPSKPSRATQQPGDARKATRGFVRCMEIKYSIVAQNWKPAALSVASEQDRG